MANPFRVLLPPFTGDQKAHSKADGYGYYRVLTDALRGFAERFLVPPLREIGGTSLKFLRKSI
jgi:hypothetical protein